MMRIHKSFPAIFFVVSIFCSCSEKQNSADGLAGNWLIVFPDHQLTSANQRAVYGRYQDSIVNLYGLKLVSLKENGECRETDSLFKPPAKWSANNEHLIIQEGGKGFNPFKTEIQGNGKGSLRLIQYLNLEDEKIKLVWNLKKVDDEAEAKHLFSDEANAWRKKPVTAETDEAIKKRLAAMLHYYDAYYKLIGREAIYFSPLRVLLPLSYYQHAIGMRGTITSSFTQFFYNEADALKGYQFLESSLDAIEGKSNSDNYVLEYASFLKAMGDWMDK